MITDTLINIIISPIYYLIDLIPLPDVEELYIPENVFTALEMILVNVGYVLPVRLIINCLVFSFVLDHFQICWVLICRLKSFVPRGLI